jgi:translation initiation factor IF-3
LSRPFSPRSSPFAGSFVRVNGKIRAREVRVVSQDGKQLGVLQLGEAINMARAQGVDLVEIAPNATPPVCRLVDYGKFRYEQAKKDKEARKHQHANKVKEVQLSATISPHDFGVKVSHAVDFLCDEMKVKVSLRFRGREMAHQEFGFQVVKKFIQELAPYGHPDAAPKLIGKGINLMLSPLPRNKRAPNPNQAAAGNGDQEEEEHPSQPGSKTRIDVNKSDSAPSPNPGTAGFGNSSFAELDLKAREEQQ